MGSVWQHRNTLILLLLAVASLQEQIAAELVAYGRGKVEWRGEIVQLSWSPRAYHLKGLLSDEECEHIKKISKDQLAASDVVNNLTGKSEKSSVRTSTGTFFDNGFDDVISAIEERVAQVTMLPKENQEGLQVLKYVDGQKYEPHYDYFHDAVNQAADRGGQRVATVLMYLATPEEGGETVFPNVDPSQRVQGPGWSHCARQGLAHKPRKGDALLFYSLTPDGVEDKHSLHGSCPTTKGEKWSATKWIHVGTYDKTAAWQKDRWKGCDDIEEHCGYWAGTGECEKNPSYMHRHCRLSCKLCSKDAVVQEAGLTRPGAAQAAAAA